MKVAVRTAPVMSAEEQEELDAVRHRLRVFGALLATQERRLYLSKLHAAVRLRRLTEPHRGGARLLDWGCLLVVWGWLEAGSVLISEELHHLAIFVSQSDTAAA